MDIIGAGLIFKFGLPENINRKGEMPLTLVDIDEEEKSRARLYDRLARAGLWLLIIGFVLQLASNFVPPAVAEVQDETNEVVQQSAVPKQP